MRALSLRRNFHRLFGRIEDEDHRKRRVISIVQSGITNLGNRVVGIIVSFLSVPLTIGYLGPERYGVWVTMGSIMAWLGLTEFGLGNGLINAITTAVGQNRNDLARTHISNGIFLLSCIAALSALVAVVGWPYVDWTAVFGVKSEATRNEIGPAVFAALAIFLLQFPLSVAGKVYLAFQEGRLSSYWGAVGNILSLVSLVVVTQLGGGLVWLVFALSGTGLLINLSSNLWLFLIHRSTLKPGVAALDFRLMRTLSQVGGKFFLIQIMALVTFQIDNLVIGHYLGASRVPEYSLTYSLFNYTALPQSILFSYLWAAYTEAIARKDIAWVSRTFHLNLWLGMAFTTVAVAGIAFIAKPFIGWWAGGTVTPSSALIGWMAAWAMINAFTNPIACLLASASHLRAQIIYSLFSTVSNIFLSIMLVQRWGVQGVIAATVISYAVFVCGPVFVDAELLLRKLRNAV